jgi:hypothetical protein
VFYFFFGAGLGALGALGALGTTTGGTNTGTDFFGISILYTENNYQFYSSH